MKAIFIENSLGTLCIVPYLGNPEMVLVIMVIDGDDTDYPPFYVPVSMLRSVLGVLYAPF